MAARQVTKSLYLAKCIRSNGAFVTVQKRCYSIIPPPWLGGKSMFEKSGRYTYPEHSESFEERMKIVAEEKLNGNGKEPHVAKNIGMELEKNAKSSRMDLLANSIKNKKNKELEKAARLQTLTIPLDEVKDDWMSENGSQQIKLVAEHYGIFRDLFGGDYFYPTMDMNVCYDLSEECLLPVCRGNIISPAEASKPPMVDINSQPDQLWTLLMVNPDEHLTNQDGEYIHWLVANIPGGDVSKGDLIVDYFQPIPPHGTGYHRNVFVLFQQKQRMDYSELKKIRGDVSLEERHFNTEAFYKIHQSHLVPRGLAFFQSQWDESVRHYFRNTLGTKEPSFEYDHPVAYHPPAKMYPHKEPFNVYFDRYRDTKDLGEEVLRQKLRGTSPYQPRTLALKYPLAHMPRKYKPSWLIQKEELMHRRINQYKDLD